MLIVCELRVTLWFGPSAKYIVSCADKYDG